MWSKNLFVLLAGLAVVAAALQSKAETSVCGQASPDVITAANVRSGIADGSVVVVDVREPQELADTGAIPGSHNIPMNDTERAFSLSPEDFKSTYGFPKPSPAALVLSCRTGRRVLTVWERIRKIGYCSARVYSGSITEWLTLEYPTEEFVLTTTATPL